MTATTDPLSTLRRAGELLHGPQWQRPLARSLGPHHPAGPRDAIDDRLVRRWSVGDRPIPQWVWAALDDLLASDNAHRLREHAEVRREIDGMTARRVRHPVAPQ